MNQLAQFYLYTAPFGCSQHEPDTQFGNVYSVIRFNLPVMKPRFLLQLAWLQEATGLVLHTAELHLCMSDFLDWPSFADTKFCHVSSVIQYKLLVTQPPFNWPSYMNQLTQF